MIDKNRLSISAMPVEISFKYYLNFTSIMYDFKQTEAEIFKFWKDRKIYEKSKKNNAKGPKFYMMDGPPYATGSIHMGTALNKILKDIAMRSRRIQGYNVFDRAGYDTHGVPIEFQIEKEIGSKSKKDIEKFGVKNFINKCKEFATRYIGVMNSESWCLDGF
jgi:isoleucyl-tRNA synthetase